MVLRRWSEHMLYVFFQCRIVRLKFLFPQLTSVAHFKQDLLYFFFFWFFIMSSLISWWLYKSVIAIFDTIVIIMINDYEYYSIVSIHLIPRVHQDKNKDFNCWTATEVRCAADLNHCFGLCSVSETWAAVYVFRVWRGGFLNYLYFSKLKAWLPQMER